MNNKINGDFDATTLEAFRAAYASREITPEDLEIDQYTGLPTNTVTNISPWIAHTGLWKANPGTDRAFIPNQPLELDDGIEDELSEDEFNRMVDEVLTDLEDEERFADRIFNSDDDDESGDEGDDEGEEDIEDVINRLLYGDEGDDDLDLDLDLEEEIEEEPMDDDELEALISEILAEADEESIEEEISGEEVPVSVDDLESMIAEMMANVDEGLDESPYLGDSDGEMSDQELEDLIREIEGEEYIDLDNED